MLCPCAETPRSNAPAAMTGRPRPAAARTCLECGEPFTSPSPEAEFCGTGCRQGFNNRRSKRGAELYDLFMALRHDRRTATTLRIWTLVSRLATIFREQDRRERAGRRSWRHPSEILERRPYLKAEVLSRGRQPMTLPAIGALRPHDGGTPESSKGHA